MDAINGQEVQIALVIREGRGFSSIKHPLYIEACLNGHYLDTNVVCPSAEPQFSEELTWFMDKKKLKTLRTSADHIRVNCYSLVGPHERENIGFLMLSLKSAQIQTDNHPQVTEAWHRLRHQTTSSRPELLLSVFIRSASTLPQIAPFVTAPTEQKVLKCGGDSVDITPQLYSEQGIIQIGPASIGTDIFLLSVVVGEASHLHLLLPENLRGQDGKDIFNFRYTIFGHTINTKKFSLDLSSDTISPSNETIKIRIRSSLSVLMMYFHRQYIVPFHMMSDDEEVALTSVDLKMLIPTDSIEEFCSKYAIGNDGVVQSSQCYLTSARTQQVPVGDDGSKPSMNIILKFKFVERQVVPAVGLGINDSRTYTLLKHHSTGQTLKESDMLQQLCISSFSAPQFVNNPESSKHSVSSHTEHLETKQSCSLDKPFIDNQENDSQQVQTTYLLLQQNNSFPPEGTHSDTQSISYQEKKNIISGSRSQETVHSHLSSGDRNFQQPLHQLAKSAVTNRNDFMHRYDLSIFVESVQFYQVFQEEKVFFKCFHPCAEVICAKHTEVLVPSTGEELPLQGVSCSLGIHSTPSQIGHMLLASPPRISVCSRTMDEQTLVLASTALDSTPLLSTDKRECCYSKILRNISTGQQVAIVKVSLLLEDVGVHVMKDDNVGRKLTEYGLGMAAPSDVVIFKVIEELEAWKEKQQEIFKAELHEKEKAHLAMLVDEWNVKKAEIEAILTKETDKCSKMAEDLVHSQEDLQLNRERILEREKEVQLLREKLEAEWAQKLHELEELGKKMEHDIDKESQWKAERADLEQTVATLQQEVKLLREYFKLREAELEEIKKSRLTKEQVTYICQELKLMEEKLQAALKGKSFYKEQWTRAAKEILRIKTQNRDALQIRIRKHERNQLTNLRATKSLLETESAKNRDQNISTDVREKMTKSWLMLTDCLESCAATSKCSHSYCSITSLVPKSADNQPENDMRVQLKKELEDKLHTVTAERDSLLRTGKYHVNDAIIEKINQDVCVLLTELKN